MLRRPALSLVLPLALVAFASLAPGCDSSSTSTTGADTGPADTGTDTAGADTASADTTTTDTGPACELTVNLAGRTFFVDTLVLEEPKDDALLQAMNPMWARDIESGALILLFDAKVHDEAAGTASMNIGSGKDDAGTYKWLNPPNPLNVAMHGCGFTTTEPAQLDLFPETVNKPIVISHLEADGSFAADGSAILKTHIVGGIRRDDATGLMVTLGSLGEIELAAFFDALGLELDLDTDGDGTPDAWKLSGYLTATAVTNVELQ